jgi:hypothetical protein
MDIPTSSLRLSSLRSTFWELLTLMELTWDSQSPTPANRLVALVLERAPSREPRARTLVNLMVTVATAPLTDMTFTESAVVLWGEQGYGLPMSRMSDADRHSVVRVRQSLVALRVFKEFVEKLNGQMQARKPTMEAVAEMEETGWRAGALASVVLSVLWMGRTRPDVGTVALTCVRDGLVAVRVKLLRIERCEWTPRAQKDSAVELLTHVNQMSCWGACETSLEDARCGDE